MILGDTIIQKLVEDVKKELPALFRISESVAELDMVHMAHFQTS